MGGARSLPESKRSEVANTFARSTAAGDATVPAFNEDGGQYRDWPVFHRDKALLDDASKSLSVVGAAGSAAVAPYADSKQREHNGMWSL
jgi:hypothetical protein